MLPQLLLKSIVLHSKKGIVQRPVALFSMRRKCKNQNQLSMLNQKEGREIRIVNRGSRHLSQRKPRRIKINLQLPQVYVVSVALLLIPLLIADSMGCVIIARSLDIN